MAGGVCLLLHAALLAAPAGAGAQEVVLKLGTLAPQGSSWHALLREMGERWAEASGGRVKLRIYAGGTQGGEGDMVRKIGVGQLQGGTLTNVGMRDILPEPSALTAPGMVDGEAEYRALFPRLRERLEAQLGARGYVVVHWVAVGTAYVFCARGYRSPAEMGEARIFVWEGDEAAVEAFRAVGFRPVVLSSVDLVPALQTGMVSCVTQPPAYALTARTFEKANHMMDYRWAWLMGATLVRRDAWEQIPPALRPRLLAIAAEIGERLDAESQRLGEQAVAAMQKQGLVVFPVDEAAWRAGAERAWPATRGKVVPAAFFDEVVRVRDQVRRQGR
jgi:TRAP-type C4-dicarboxylate transport system substrate-binding protein